MASCHFNNFFCLNWVIQYLKIRLNCRDPLQYLYSWRSVEDLQKGAGTRIEPGPADAPLSDLRRTLLNMLSPPPLTTICAHICGYCIAHFLLFSSWSDTKKINSIPCIGRISEGHILPSSSCNPPPPPPPQLADCVKWWMIGTWSRIHKPYNFIEVSRHNLESSWTWGFLNHRKGGMVFYQVFLLSHLQTL